MENQHDSNMSCGRRKKALFFTLDAILAGLVIVTGVILASSFYVHYKSNSNAQFISEDIINVLSELKVSELSSAIITNLTSNGTIDDPDRSVMEQVGIFWSRNQTVWAQAILSDVEQSIVPSSLGFGVYIDDEVIYEKNLTVNGDVVKHTSYISGIEKTKPIDGYTARVYLQGIDSRIGYSYANFGGFEGEGNLTKLLMLPKNISINEVVMELDAGTNFQLYINGHYAGEYPSGSGNGTYLRPDRWVLNSAYIDLFNEGLNRITINFTDIGNLTTDRQLYIAGGYIRVSYSTDIPVLSVPSATKTEVVNLPGIDGFINLFSSLSIPGNLSGLDLYLHYRSNYTTFVQLGNITIYKGNSNNTDMNVSVNSSVITNILNAHHQDFTAWSYTTLPLRVGLVNVSVIGMPTDIMLLTDVSGSMSSDYMQSLSHRVEGATDQNKYSVSLSHGEENIRIITLPNETFDYESIDISAVGSNYHNVDLWVTPPGESETRAQCDEDPDPCHTVDHDNDEYYYRNSNVHAGNWTIRVRSSANQDVTVNIRVSKIDGARSAADEFIKSTLSKEGPLIGLVSYSTTTQDTHELSDDIESLTDEVDSYSASGGTCICCGINSGVTLLVSNSNASIIIPRKSSGWRYNDYDIPSPPSGWTTLSFNDSSWLSGTSIFRNQYNSLGSPRTIVNKYGGDYYFRRKFTVSNVSVVKNSTLYILSDNGADIYLNGQMVDNDYSSTHTAQYWNRMVSIDPSLLQTGENIITARVRNTEICWWWWCWADDIAFDLELAVDYSSNTSEIRHKSMILLTDGQATNECVEQGWTPDLNGDGYSDRPEDDAIQAACDAYDNFGIKTYTIGFGQDADVNTLQRIANCSDARYYSSNNTDQLMSVFRDIGLEILQYTETQVSNTTDILPSSLFADSYIRLNYTENLQPELYSRIPVTIESQPLGNNLTSGTVYLPDDVTLINFSLTSYSADKWTDLITLSNSGGNMTVFNLSSYNMNYQLLGDAFSLSIPPSLFRNGENNTINIHINDATRNATEGSPYDRFIYTILLNNAVDYSAVYPNGVGCNWTITFEDMTTLITSIPDDINITKHCYYENATYDRDDAIDVVVYKLFDYLDFDDDGLLDVKIGPEDVSMDSLAIDKVPSMWGPSEVQTRVWK